MKISIDLRRTFNKEPQLYHTARPHYPEELFDSLIKHTHLSNEANLLEIGPGTGQATEPFAQRGYSITAIELGENLAKLTRENFAKYTKIKIVNSAFEDAKLESESFDLVYAANAFHWIEPKVKYKKLHRILKEKGHLAVIKTHHVSDNKGDEFFSASQPIYKKYKPGGIFNEHSRLSTIEELEPEESIDEKRFTPVFFNAFSSEIHYSAREYAQLLNTYSPVLSMKKTQRMQFLEEIEKLIREKFDNHLQRQFATTLTIMRKKHYSLEK